MMLLVSQYTVMCTTGFRSNKFMLTDNILGQIKTLCMQYLEIYRSKPSSIMYGLSLFSKNAFLLFRLNISEIDFCYFI